MGLKAYSRIHAVRTGLTVLLLLGLLVLPGGPALAARTASLVVDYDTGAVLYADSPDAAVYPASLTKAMTLYLAFEALKRGRLKLDDRLEVSPRAASMAPSKLGLKAGSSIRTEDAILSLVTKSANDSAVVIAEALAGSEAAFARAMTAKARLLGMTRTVFYNASGLPHPEQRTTARDMVRLGASLIRDFPDYYNWFSTPAFTYRGQSHRNHNGLLGQYKGMDGLKTGYIRASGFNLLASAKRDGRRLVGAVFGGNNAASRNATMAKLLDKGFAQVALASAGKLADEPETADDAEALLASAGAAAFGDRAQGDVDGAAGPDSRPGTAAAVGAKSTKKATIAPVKKGTVVAAAPTAARAAKSVRRGAYGVQVGAFSSRALAQRAAATAVRQVAAILKSEAARVDAIRTRKQTLYRAILVGLQQDDANAACRQLKRKGHPCLVIKLGA
jgi:D-alanyl-D-alanine carboxypeptidase